MPVGYDSIAQIFNLEPSNPYKLSVICDNGRCIHSNYPEPSPTYLFGPPAQEAPPVATDPRVGEIGSWLIDRELWKNKKNKEEHEHRGMRRGPEGREMVKEERHEEEVRTYGGRNQKRRPRGQKGPEHDEGRKRTRCCRSAEYGRDRTPAYHMDETSQAGPSSHHSASEHQLTTLDRELDDHRARHEELLTAEGDYKMIGDPEDQAVDTLEGSESAALAGEQTVGEDHINFE